MSTTNMSFTTPLFPARPRGRPQDHPQGWPCGRRDADRQPVHRQGAWRGTDQDRPRQPFHRHRYAGSLGNQQIGCQFAIDEIKKRRHALGRRQGDAVADVPARTPCWPVQAQKLLDRDKVNFLLGNVNSAMALAIGDVSSKAGVLHIVTGGHTDAVTGKDCHWNVFRVCNTTRMETNSVSKILFISSARNGISSRRTTPSAIRFSRASKPA